MTSSSCEREPTYVDVVQVSRSLLTSKQFGRRQNAANTQLGESQQNSKWNGSDIVYEMNIYS